MRYSYSWKQVHAKLQSLAYKIALDAVQNIGKYSNVRVVANSPPKLDEVSNGIEGFSFRLRSASYVYKDPPNWRNNWAFVIEQKEYNNTNDRTKISFYAGDEPKDIAGAKKKIMDFLTELMGEEKPEPRFSLSKFAAKHIK